MFPIDMDKIKFSVFVVRFIKMFNIGNPVNLLRIVPNFYFIKEYFFNIFQEWIGVERNSFCNRVVAEKRENPPSLLNANFKNRLGAMSESCV
jgi:hypothetical protein